jgi:hypothetical protein
VGTLRPTTTALPTTGLFDDSNLSLPAAIGLAILLIGVIAAARRLRSANS